MATEHAVVSQFQPTIVHETRLDRCNVPDERVQLWHQNDATLQRDMGRRGTSQKELLPNNVRKAIVQFMESMCQEAGLHIGDWFKTVLIFDTWCTRSSARVEHVPAACAASVAIVQKFDCACPEWLKPGFESYIPTTVRIAKWLHDSMNYTNVSLDITEELIGDVEGQVLKAMRWSSPPPHFDAWVESLWKRLNVYTDDMFDEQLRFLFPNAASVPVMTRWFILGQRTHADLTPRQIGLGLFCYGLVRVGLLPVEALSSLAKEGAWDQLFQLPLFRPQACVQSPAQVQRMLCCLEVACGTDLRTISSDCEAVASAMMQMYYEQISVDSPVAAGIPAVATMNEDCLRQDFSKAVVAVPDLPKTEVLAWLQDKAESRSTNTDKPKDESNVDAVFLFTSHTAGVVHCKSKKYPTRLKA